MLDCSVNIISRTLLLVATILVVIFVHLGDVMCEANSNDPMPLRNCSKCVPHDDARFMRIAQIKSQILGKLGMSKVPNVSTEALQNVATLNRLMEMYGMTKDLDQMQGDQPAFQEGEQEFEENDDYHVNAEKSISFAQNVPEDLQLDPEWEVKYFKLSDRILNHHVAKAQLWLHVKNSGTSRSASHHAKKLWITLYQVQRGTKGIHLVKMGHHEVSAQLNKRNRWVHVDMRKIVTHWIRHPSENLGLVAHAYYGDGRKASIGEGVNTPQNSFVEVHVEKSRHIRRRRQVGLNCQESSNEVRCCRYPLTVDFEEFGWDWIIAPKRYEANYCSGECPYVFEQKYPHTHLVQQANLSGNTGPCCAPRKISSISMLYFDDNHNIVYGVLPGMIVDRCGCY